MLMGGRLFHFANHTVEICCDEQKISAALDTYFQYCAGEDGPVAAHYKIAALEDGNFSLSADDSILFPKLNQDQILLQATQDAITRLNGAASESLVFHAAGLAYRGSGVMLCGESGSGKSTLAAWMLANGFQYLTDEVVSFSLNQDEIKGLSRSLVLKRGSSFIWQRWLPRADSSAGFLQFKDGSAWIPPALFHADVVCEAAVPRVLIFPRYIPGSQFQTKQLTPAETLFRLLQCLVNARNFLDYGVSAATRLARQTSAFTMTYSDIEGAARWITEKIAE